MIRNQTIRNERGYSLIELAIGSALAAIVTVATVSAMTIIATQQTKMVTGSSDYVDTSTAERTILLDLRNLDPSFNLMTGVKDDNGLQFYDYFPDVPFTMLQNRTRVAVLSLDRKYSMTLRSEFFFLSVDQRPGQSSILIYDPVAAYNIGAAPNDFNVPTSLGFAGLNRNGWVQKQVGFWRDKQLIMLDTSAFLRPKRANPALVPPRSPAFVGMIQASQVSADAYLSKFFTLVAPWDNATNLNSPDAFLRNLPAVGGAQPTVRLRSVKLLHYYLVDKKGAGADLFRQVYIGNGMFSSPFLVSSNVSYVKFTRDDITNKSIGFSVEKVPIK